MEQLFQVFGRDLASWRQHDTRGHACIAWGTISQEVHRPPGSQAMCWSERKAEIFTVHGTKLSNDFFEKTSNPNFWTCNPILSLSLWYLPNHVVERMQYNRVNYALLAPN
jgi:hypothetical protein